MHSGPAEALEAADADGGGRWPPPYSGAVSPGALARGGKEGWAPPPPWAGEGARSAHPHGPVAPSAGAPMSRGADGGRWFPGTAEAGVADGPGRLPSPYVAEEGEGGRLPRPDVPGAPSRAPLARGRDAGRPQRAQASGEGGRSPRSCAPGGDAGWAGLAAGATGEDGEVSEDGAAAAPPARETGRPAAGDARSPRRGICAPRVDLMEGGAPEALRAALFAAPARPATVGPLPVRPQPGGRAVVVLVGPTGTGKTVTAAKLAAHLHLQQGWRVGLVSTDALRVGAVEQLGAYARLLSLPFEAAPTPAALERALQRMAATDVVVVDTAGCCHRDGRGLRDLAAQLDAAARAAGGSAGRAPAPSPAGINGQPQARAGGPEPPSPVADAGHAQSPPVGPPASPWNGGIEVHLVLEATARRAEAEAVLATYRASLHACATGAARLLLTKLDACAAPPEVTGVAAARGLPLSYFAAGPRVPDDLAVAWPDRLAEALAMARTAQGA